MTNTPILALFLEIGDTIVNWAFDHFPTITTFLILIIVACWLTWWAHGMFFYYRTKFIKVETDCRQLDKNQTYFNKKITGIDNKLNMLVIHLSSTKKIDANLFKSASPIELTETGTKILIEMGGKTFIDNNFNSLLISMEAQQFKSGLDVQNYCSVLLNEKITDDALIPVKDYIYRTPVYQLNPETAIPLDLTMAITIMGIYLRNKYFERHPALKQGM